MKIPVYIPQESGGHCGAAALAMVLNIFDIHEPPQKIASQLTFFDPNGQPRIKTHMLANYARNLGLSVMVVQFSDPWKALIRCHEAGLGVIINHRLEMGKSGGHFSTLSDIRPANNDLSLHDPQRGPNIRLSREELLELWSPNVAGSQIAGMVGIVVGPRPIGGVAGICSLCSTDLDDQSPLKCEGCSMVLEPLPGFTLGCLANDCSRKLWRKIFCPNCDRVWSARFIPHEKPVARDNRQINPSTLLNNSGIEFTPQNQLESKIATPTTPALDVDISAQKLTEALLSIPKPDWGVISALAEAQKQTLLELSEFSNIAHDLQERAMEWDTVAEDVKQVSTSLDEFHKNLAAEMRTTAESFAKESEKISKLNEIVPKHDEPSEEQQNPESKKDKPQLPTGAELVARLIAMANQNKNQ